MTVMPKVGEILFISKCDYPQVRRKTALMAAAITLALRAPPIYLPEYAASDSPTYIKNNPNYNGGVPPASYKNLKKLNKQKTKARRKASSRSRKANR